MVRKLKNAAFPVPLFRRLATSRHPTPHSKGAPRRQCRCSARRKGRSRRNQNWHAIPQPTRDCRCAASQTRKTSPIMTTPRRAHPPFAGILQVDASKEQRKQDGGWPENRCLWLSPPGPLERNRPMISTKPGGSQPEADAVPLDDSCAGRQKSAENRIAAVQKPMSAQGETGCIPETKNSSNKPTTRKKHTAHSIAQRKS